MEETSNSEKSCKKRVRNMLCLILFVLKCTWAKKETSTFFISPVIILYATQRNTCSAHSLDGIFIYIRFFFCEYFIILFHEWRCSNQIYLFLCLTMLLLLFGHSFIHKNFRKQKKIIFFRQNMWTNFCVKLFNSRFTPLFTIYFFFS